MVAPVEERVLRDVRMLTDFPRAGISIRAAHCKQADSYCGDGLLLLLSASTKHCGVYYY